MSKVEDALKEYYEANPFQAKLTFEQRCAVYAYFKYRGVSKNILHRAYGISTRTIDKMANKYSDYYQNVRDTADRLGMQEFCRVYLTEDNEVRVANTIKEMKLGVKLKRIDFDPAANPSLIGLQTFRSYGGLVLLYIGIVPVQITWPYRTWGFRIMNHPLSFEIGYWDFPQRYEHLAGRNLNILRQWINKQLGIPNSIFDWSQWTKDWVKEPDFDAVEQEQIKGTIELMKDRHLYPHDEEPNWEVIADVNFPMMASDSELVRRV